MEKLGEPSLRYYYVKKDLSQREIAGKFNLTQSCISKKMKKYGIESDYNGFWSQEEEERLMKIYNEKPREDILSEFPDRSWNAIKLKAIELDLSKPIEEHRQSEDVRKRLAKNAEEKAIEIDFSKNKAISYILGVIDGDGYTDNKGTVGLEVNNPDFADKFVRNLEKVGLNPGRGQRRGKNTVWASSKKLVEWINNFDYDSKFEWLKQEGDIWGYIEGAYDSDGDFSNPGPRICSYDEDEKRFIKRLYDLLDLESSIHSNNVYVKVSSKDRFFENIDPAYEKRSP